MRSEPAGTLAGHAMHGHPDRTASAPSIRVAAVVNGKNKEWNGEKAVAAIGHGGPADPTPKAANVWIDLTEPDAAFVARIADALGLHPLVAEDIVEGNQRGKIEVTDGLIHVVLFVLGASTDHVAQEV